MSDTVHKWITKVMKAKKRTYNVEDGNGFNMNKIQNASLTFSGFAQISWKFCKTIVVFGMPLFHSRQIQKKRKLMCNCALHRVKFKFGKVGY